MSNKIERLNAAPQFRTEKKEGGLPEIVGYAAVFNSKTDIGPFTESIARGAFKASLERADDVAALFNHNPNYVLGRTPNTLSLSEDEHGLFMRIQTPDTQLGRDLTLHIERGDIKKASFGFYIEEETIDRSGDKTHFTILKARLFDVSPVTFPAYDSTEVELQRSLSDRLRRHMPEAEVLKAMKELRDRKIALARLQAN